MIRIAIVEDAGRDRNLLRDLLGRYAQENQVQLRISEFADGDAITAGYRPEYDIILMDIELAFVDGMTAAKEIRQLDSEVAIIFVTNSPQYAMEGYKVGAIDYLVKPVDYYAFSEAIRRADSLRERREDKQYILLSLRDYTRKVEISRIRFVEVRDHDLFFNTLDGVFETKGSIRETESRLNSPVFFQCNKGCLVNLEFVEGYGKDDVKIGEHRIQVSRARKRAFQEAMQRYLDLL